LVSHEKSFVVRSVVDGFERHGTRFLKRMAASSSSSFRYVTISRKAAYGYVKTSLGTAVDQLMMMERRRRQQQHQQQQREQETREQDARAKASAEAVAVVPIPAVPTPTPAPSQGGRKHPPRPRLDNPVPFGEKAQPTFVPRTLEQSGPRPLQPHPNDVVFGRGNNIANHPGNLLFREFVLQEKDTYGAAPRQVKAVIAGRVVERILKLSPPGRFLEIGDDGRYYDVDPHRVFEKTCQACRERKWSRASAARSTSGPSPHPAVAAALSGHDSPYEWYGQMGDSAAAMAEQGR
jgi:hypothetical protein